MWEHLRDRSLLRSLYLIGVVETCSSLLQLLTSTVHSSSRTDPSLDERIAWRECRSGRAEKNRRGKDGILLACESCIKFALLSVSHNGGETR